MGSCTAMKISRRFLLLFCGMMASPRLRAYAKQLETLRTIGILARELKPGLLEAFRDELQKIGYVDGVNIKIEVRDAAGQNDRLPSLHRNCWPQKSR